MTRGFRNWIPRVNSDQEGATLVEFAMIAPVFFLMLMGLFDFGFQIYAQSVVQGAVHSAARDTSLENGAGKLAAIDEAVTRQVVRIAPGSNITFERKNYASFSDIGRAEDFVDTNGNSKCDNGEAFEDINRNKVWDADRGATGVGGARDAVLYTASARFDRLFPFYAMIGLPPQSIVTGQTVLRNQPYQEQGARDPVVETCP